MNISFILQQKFPDARINIDYQIGDKGNGPEIVQWNLPDPQPIQKDLDTWEIEFKDAYDLQQICLKRQAAYPPKEDLIVAMWERFVEGKTDATDVLQAVREQVKLDNPKPAE